MSITDELREYTKHYSVAGSKKDTMLSSISDRIDAEHQKALDEWKAEHGQMWLKGYAECHAELLEGNETLASDLEGCGWIRLPKDADGEYIHVGDVMEPNGANSLFGQASFEVRAMRYDEGGWEVYDRLGDRYAPSLLRHYHAPTVEDVLTEFGIYWEHESDCEDRAALLKEYASKLRLVEGEDA